MPEQAGRRRDAAARLTPAAAALAAVAMVLLPVAPAAAAPAGPATHSVPCQVTDPRLPELSGLVAVGEEYLAVNDGGDRVDVYVLDAACRVSTVHTAAVDPYDLEDLAVAADGTVWLADTGDNRGGRETVALIALRPDGTTGLYRLAYPDGPHDAEALLLAPDGTPYLVTKEVLGASAVYRPVSALVDNGTVGLVEVGEVEFTLTGTPGGPVGRAGQLMVTGGAVARDGGALALRTYTDAYVWPLVGSEVVGALAGDPVRIPLPEAPQGEAVTFTPDGAALVVAGEGLPGDLAVVPVPAASLAAPSTAADDGLHGLLGADGSGPSPLPAAVVAAAVAAILVRIGGRLRRRWSPPPA